MGKVKELESEIPEFDPETHKWDWELKQVVPLTPEELAAIARSKRKADLEKRFTEVMHNNRPYLKAFGSRVEIIQGTKHIIPHGREIDEWDRDDLDDFEQKILKLESAKKELDEEEKRERPMFNRRKEYQKIDHLLLEALVEGGGMIVDGVEKPSEKMQAYLKLRDEIKARFPK